MEDKLEKLKKKNDLSDIILEKEGNSGENIKKILLGVASLILLFLIVLIVMKMFNNSEISPSENLASIGEQIETNDKGIIEAIDDGQDSLFKEEPIIDEVSDTDLKFEEMVRRLKQQDSDTYEETKNQEKATDTTNDNRNIIDKIKETTQNTTKQVAQKVEQTVQAIKPQVKIKPEPIVIRKVEPIKTPQPQKIFIEKDPIQTTTTVEPYPISAISGYFIQVGATYNSFPTKNFLNTIKNSGYDYIVHKVMIKGRSVKKVLVGPYTTRDQARNELNDVQTRINPSAYIYRIR